MYVTHSKTGHSIWINPRMVTQIFIHPDSGFVVIECGSCIETDSENLIEMVALVEKFLPNIS